MEWPRGVDCIKTGGGRALCTLYITSGRRIVRLNSLQGLYERFLIRNLIRQLQPHRRDCLLGEGSSTQYTVLSLLGKPYSGLYVAPGGKPYSGLCSARGKTIFWTMYRQGENHILDYVVPGGKPYSELCSARGKTTLWTMQCQGEKHILNYVAPGGKPYSELCSARGKTTFWTMQCQGEKHILNYVAPDGKPYSELCSARGKNIF